MRVRDWRDILDDVAESSAAPDDWRAVAGDRHDGIGEDLYLGHPDAGVFQLKTYAKNPFEVQGVGTELARRIDDDLDPLFPERAGGRFGVQRGIEDGNDAEQAVKRLGSVVETHRDAPTTPGDFFEDVMDALDSPAYGPMEYDAYGRPDGLDHLADEFEEADRLLDADLDDLVDEGGVGHGFQ
ncbi:hypothetical protein [Halomarina oriensis]|uniref:Uncharacterized protein n=1 Tax=Halomarina oriensis TaxID=671145 RepID=A0A6B0GU23_9EURY|nr:hypothetical protein [Halomarina oriensis]MWG36877.1 hypothetical protein [Halomarina oriensis]